MICSVRSPEERRPAVILAFIGASPMLVLASLGWAARWVSALPGDACTIKKMKQHNSNNSHNIDIGFTPVATRFGSANWHEAVAQRSARESMNTCYAGPASAAGTADQPGQPYSATVAPKPQPAAGVLGGRRDSNARWATKSRKHEIFLGYVLPGGGQAPDTGTRRPD